MSNSRLENKLDIILMKLNYITNVLEFGRQPRMPYIPRNYYNPFAVPQYTVPQYAAPHHAAPPANNNTTNNPNDETFEFTFSAPTTNTPNILSSLLNINSLIPEAPENIRLTHREIMDNTTLIIAGPEHTTEMCSISRENFNEGDIIRKINQCGHFFLYSNLDNWLTTNNTCPLCRINIVPSTETNTNGI
jgi:hypothetical protein